MKPCVFCGKYDDYTDQFVVQLSTRKAVACWSCFQKLIQGKTMQSTGYYQLEFDFMKNYE